ncbi:hypothetical protein [Nocardia sp. NPDC003963]
MSGEEEERRRRYAEQQRREQRERSALGRKSNDKGRWFHYGIAEMRGETPDKGWRHEVPQQLPSGEERHHDNSRAVNDFEFREYKGAKRLRGEFTLKQIDKDREALTLDKKATGAWVVIEGSPEPDIRRALDDMVRDFKGRFRVEEVTQEQANRAEKIGRDLERNRDQLELIPSKGLRAQQRLRELQERAAEKTRTQAAAREAQEKQGRERQIAREQQQQREAVARLAQRAQEQREAAERGERPPMDGRDAADILRINRPPPGVESPFREPPQPTRGGRDAPGRERDRGQERGR